MNDKLRKINELISICGDMVKATEQSGSLRYGNVLYEKYKRALNEVVIELKLKETNAGLYGALGGLYFEGRGYTVNLSEAKQIYKLVVELKHEMYPNCFDKIFISHSEKDHDRVIEFVELLYAIGIPRPRKSDKEKFIFCSSHPDGYIDNSHSIISDIKEQFNGKHNIYYILWYSDNYFNSQACLNEAGAIWVMSKPYLELLEPSFDEKNIKGLLDKQIVWARINDKYRLNSLKEDIEKMFNIVPLTENTWELARDKFLSRIKT